MMARDWTMVKDAMRLYIYIYIYIFIYIYIYIFIYLYIVHIANKNCWWMDMRCVRNLPWPDEFEKVNCKDEEDNGKDRRYLLCETSVFFLENIKLKLLIIYISGGFATLDIRIWWWGYAKLGTTSDH